VAEPKLASSPVANSFAPGEARLAHPIRVMSCRGIVLSVWVGGVETALTL
jgi:hypothetical protein